MAVLTPTIDATRYSGVSGDRKRVIVDGTIAGTYASATASDGGALLTPAQVGLRGFSSVRISPKFSADTIEEYPVSFGPSTSSTAGHVIALADKADNLETADTTAVTGVLFSADILGF